jgi:hypothetical protein
MAPHASSLTIVDVPPLAERRRILRREEIRDFAGVAIGVTLGALVWLAVLSLARAYV